MPEFIDDHFRLIIFVVIAGIAVLQKLLDSAKARKQRPEPEMKDIFVPDGEPAAPSRRKPYTPPPVGRAEVVPASPPPLRQPAPPPPPLPPLRGGVSAALSTTNTDAELARQRQLEERIRALREVGAPATPDPSAATVPTAARRSAPAPHGVLHRRLRHPRELRRAFILKEILDRPVGLR